MTAPAPARRAPPGILVGRDLGGEPAQRRGRAALWPLVALAVVVGLAAAWLRNDILSLRYALSSAMQQERTLLQERRELTARVRALRDPSRLARLARERGFERPAQVLESGAGAAR